MKKVVLSLAVLFSMAMVSCGGNKATEATDSDSVEVVIDDTVAVEATSDSTANVEVTADTTVVEAPAEATK